MTEPLCFDGRLSPARHMSTDLRAALKIFAAHPPVSRYEPLALATPAAGRELLLASQRGGVDEVDSAEHPILSARPWRHSAYSQALYGEAGCGLNPS
jgi:hypothetical protein